MSRIPLYPHPAEYAQEHGELEAYRASHKENVACKEAIEAAINEHYGNNRLGDAAAKQVIGRFGFDRTLYVLANTVRQEAWDGRISRENKEWARTVPVVADQDAWGKNRNIWFSVCAVNPGLTDIFIDQVRHEYLLTQPLSKAEIEKEAARILSRLQEEREPNSPEGTHFMAKLSPDFVIRASSKDQGRLMKALPFSTLTLSNLKDREGVYAFISKDENRDQPLRRGRSSVRGKLQNTASAPKPAAAAKKKEQVR